ncbi:MAG: hypothetical protein V1779_10750 [bacterium]
MNTMNTFLMNLQLLSNDGMSIANKVFWDYENQWDKENANPKTFCKIMASDELREKFKQDFREQLNKMLMKETDYDKLQNLITLADELQKVDEGLEE